MHTLIQLIRRAILHRGTARSVQAKRHAPPFVSGPLSTASDRWENPHPAAFFEHRVTVGVGPVDKNQLYQICGNAQLIEPAGQ